MNIAILSALPGNSNTLRTKDAMHIINILKLGRSRKDIHLATKLVTDDNGIKVDTQLFNNLMDGAARIADVHLVLLSSRNIKLILT